MSVLKVENNDFRIEISSGQQMYTKEVCRHWHQRHLPDHFEINVSHLFHSKGLRRVSRR